jgi:hypothetical protein
MVTTTSLNAIVHSVVRIPSGSSASEFVVAVFSSKRVV